MVRQKAHDVFHEKAAPCQECFALSMSSSLFFPFSQAASVATLPSAHSCVSGFRSVQVGCSRFIRRCYLISVLRSLFTREVGPRHLSQSPKLGGRAQLFGANSFSARFFYAAAFIAFWLLRNGSYTSPLTHNRCSSTASFRATATTARFLAFFPPRAESFRPQRRKSRSSPKGSQNVMRPLHQQRP